MLIIPGNVKHIVLPKCMHRTYDKKWTGDPEESKQRSWVPVHNDVINMT